ncbi:MAG: hypothetical protein WKG07_48530 [Hymenobacter sp.]
MPVRIAALRSAITGVLMHRAPKFLGIIPLIWASYSYPLFHETTAYFRASQPGGARRVGPIRPALYHAYPLATSRPKALVSPYGTRTDNYYWLNERENPEVLGYLKDENAYFDQQMAPVKGLEAKLFTEMKGRIKEQDESVPYRDHGYYYYTRYETGGEYPLYCRKAGSLQGTEEIMLNGNQMGQGHSYFAIGGSEVSDNNELLAYSTDTVSRRLYTLRFKNLKTGQLYPEKIANTAGNAVWAADNQTVFYAKKDVTTLLPYQVYRHVLGTDPAQDVLIYEEKDDTFGLHVSRSKSRQYLGIELSNAFSSEYRYLDAATPTGEFKVFAPRSPDLLYEVQDANGKFYVFTNWEAPNFRVMAAPLASPGRDQWQEVIPQREDVFLEQMELFKNYLVLNEREEGMLPAARYQLQGPEGRRSRLPRAGLHHLHRAPTPSSTRRCCASPTPPSRPRPAPTTTT